MRGEDSKEKGKKILKRSGGRKEEVHRETEKFGRLGQEKLTGGQADEERLARDLRGDKKEIKYIHLYQRQSLAWR